MKLWNPGFYRVGHGTARLIAYRLSEKLPRARGWLLAYEDRGAQPISLPSPSRTMAADYEPECPECGEDMVIRKNRKTGEQFYGCVMYPQCTGTEQIQSAPKKGDYPDWARDPNG